MVAQPVVPEPTLAGIWIREFRGPRLRPPEASRATLGGATGFQTHWSSGMSASSGSVSMSRTSRILGWSPNTL